MTAITRTLFAVFLVLGIPLGSASAQQIHYVDVSANGSNNGTSWQNAYTDLQLALNSVFSGDEIWVAAGTYTPTAPNGDRNATFALQSGVAIYGGFAGDETSLDERDPAANPTILSGDLNGDDTPRWLNGHNSFLNPQDNIYHVVVADGVDATAVLDGVVVTHGYAYRLGYVGPEFEAGGGILILNGDPSITNVTIALNAGPRGGGVAVLGGNPVFTNTVFSENYADIGSGGAVYNDGTSVSAFYNSVFRANAAIGGGVNDGLGGAIYNYIGGEITVRSSTFVRNITGYRTYSSSENRTRGGAIATYGIAADVRNSQFYGNKSHLGGAIYGYRITVTNSNFSGNQAHDVRAVGLAAAGLGGAIVALGDDNYFSNTTVAGNTSTDNGAGMYTSGTTVVANSIFWGNILTGFIEPGEDPVPLVKIQIHKGGGSLDILYSDVEGLFETIPGEDPPEPENFPGSIDAYPFFADPRGADNVVGTEDDDLRLTGGSPAIDAGDNASVPVGAVTDLDGNDRFADDPATPDTGAGTAPIVDMGAYEFASETSGNQLPVAIAATIPGTALDVSFDATASYDPDGTITAFDWNFGDGNASSAQTTSHTYATAGTYTVGLMVTDNDGATNSTSQSVTVSGPANVPPTASFTVSTFDLTASFIDSSTDSDGSIVSRSWSFGDGNASSAQTTSHTYAMVGTYTVGLMVTDNDGATDSTSQSVTVSGPAPQLPAAPSNLTADVQKTGKGKKKVITRVVLNWTDNANNENNFVVERCLEQTTGKGKNRTVTCNFAFHASVDANDTRFVAPIDSGYRYRVKATNGVGPSDYSNEVKI